MNKKIIKTIAVITCGLGIATAIPFATTSCGSKSTSLDHIGSYDALENFDPSKYGVPTLKTCEITCVPLPSSNDLQSLKEDATAATKTIIDNIPENGSLKNFIKYTLIGMAKSNTMIIGDDIKFSCDIDSFKLGESSTNTIKFSGKFTLKTSASTTEAGVKVTTSNVFKVSTIDSETLIKGLTYDFIAASSGASIGYLMSSTGTLTDKIFKLEQTTTVNGIETKSPVQEIPYMSFTFGEKESKMYAPWDNVAFK